MAPRAPFAKDTLWSKLLNYSPSGRHWLSSLSNSNYSDARRPGLKPSFAEYIYPCVSDTFMLFGGGISNVDDILGLNSIAAKTKREEHRESKQLLKAGKCYQSPVLILVWYSFVDKERSHVASLWIETPVFGICLEVKYPLWLDPWSRTQVMASDTLTSGRGCQLRNFWSNNGLHPPKQGGTLWPSMSLTDLLRASIVLELFSSYCVCLVFNACLSTRKAPPSISFEFGAIFEANTSLKSRERTPVEPTAPKDSTRT